MGAQEASRAPKETSALEQRHDPAPRVGEQRLFAPHVEVAAAPSLHALHPVRSPSHSERLRTRPVGGWLKRSADLTLALLALMVLSPVFAIVLVLIMTTSPGPAFFLQRRVGFRGKVFLVYKFRTMTTREDGDRIAQAVENDARITFVGRFLRRSSLDELPQLLNVLRGEMSMVGPRPHAVAHDRAFRTIAPDYRLRMRALPGITGLAQIKGFRGEIGTDADIIGRSYYDAEYTRRQSVWLDLYILFMTAFVVLWDLIPGAQRKKAATNTARAPAAPLAATAQVISIADEREKANASDPDAPLESFEVLGVPITVTNLDKACATLHLWASDDKARFVFVREAASLMAALDDPELFALHQKAAMVTPDGMPLVWLGKLAGRKIERTCGPDLMLKMMAVSAKSALKHYFYGGKEGVAEMLKQRFEAEHPGLQIVGVGTPPFRPLTKEELGEAAAAINASGADVVWIGISSPKQEFLMRDLAPLVHCTMIGVGAAFDFHSGAVQRAPVWMQRAGLEWLWRLASEPKRLWRRYLVLVPRLGFRLAAAAIRGRA